MREQQEQEQEERTKICWVCGETVETILDNHYPDREFIQCKNCSAELDRLSDIESDQDNLQKQNTSLLRTVSQLQETISNIKHILT